LAAIAEDEFGNEIVGATYEWFSNGPPVTIDEPGIATAGIVAGDFAGLLGVVTTVGDLSTETLVDVRILPGRLSELAVEPGSATLDIGERQVFTFKALDEFGNHVSDAVFAWSSSTDIGRLDSEGVLVSGTKAGVFPSSVSIQAVMGSERLSASADITILPDVVVSVALLSSPLTLQPRTTHQFTAIGRDQHGNEIADLAFLCETSNGEIDQSGLLTTGLFGATEVRVSVATDGAAFSDSASLEVPMLGKIVFDSDRSGDREIWVMDSDGSNPLQITFDRARNGFPAWSPDGERIVFTSNRTGSFDLYIMDSDGNNQIALTNSSMVDREPSWSPDGKKILFRRLFGDGFETSEIFVINPDGSDLTQLTFSFNYDANPDWSPDGTSITFRRRLSGSDGIFVMNADGSNVQRITVNQSEERVPRWSPDGTIIAFTRDQAMWLMNADGSNETALVPGSPQSWSADGNHLAFQRADAEGDLELFVLDFVVDDPPVERQLTFNSASDFRPDWHPAPR
jgi:hypothetical protein